MRMTNLLLILALTSVAFGETAPAKQLGKTVEKGIVTDAPKQTEKPLPTAPANYASQIQAVVIQIKDEQIKQRDLASQYKASMDHLTQLSEQGSKLEADMLKSLDLDPAKYTTQTAPDGTIKIVKQ